MELSPKNFIELSKDNCVIGVGVDFQLYKNSLYFCFNEKSVCVDLLNWSYTSMGITIPSLMIDKDGLIKLKKFLNENLTETNIGKLDNEKRHEA